jgi:carboxypeptidase C (cathepsin A)
LLGPYVVYSGRSVYDIRNLPDTPDTSYYSEFLNNASVQAALGVSVNSTLTNNDVYFAFQQSGDAVTGYAFQALEKLLGQGVRVVLYYGDADVSPKTLFSGILF